MRVAHQIANGLAIVVTGHQQVSMLEWESFLKALEDNLGAIKGMLVCITDAPPDAKQRRQLGKLLLRGAFSVAVLTSSPLARDAVTAMAWIAGRIKTFEPVDLGDALQFLAVPDADSHRIITILGAMKGEISS